MKGIAVLALQGGFAAHGRRLAEIGLDSFEIAAARGNSASGTRARIARVLAQLRKELDRD